MCLSFVAVCRPALRGGNAPACARALRVCAAQHVVSVAKAQELHAMSVVQRTLLKTLLKSTTGAPGLQAGVGGCWLSAVSPSAAFAAAPLLVSMSAALPACVSSIAPGSAWLVGSALTRTSCAQPRVRSDVRSSNSTPGIYWFDRSSTFGTTETRCAL